MKRRFLFLLLGSSTLSGVSCVGFEPFQPNPPEHEEWFKAGSSEDEVVAMLLECGYTHPRGPDRNVRDEMTNNEIALSHLCMKGQGYIFGGGRYDFCAGFRDALPACRSDAIPPNPKKEIRLNSEFCRQYPNARVCQADW